MLRQEFAATSDSHLPFWNQPEASSEVFVRIDGKRFLRTGDLACVDQGGCFKITEQEITDWSHGNMAACEVPRIVEFVGTLPKSGAGKVMWRSLQEAEKTSTQESTTAVRSCGTFHESGASTALFVSSVATRFAEAGSCRAPPTDAV